MASWRTNLNPPKRLSRSANHSLVSASVACRRRRLSTRTVLLLGPRIVSPLTPPSPREERGEGAGARSALLDEGPVAQLGDRRLQLRLRVHHDWTIPGDRLLDRLAGNQQEADAVLAGQHRDLGAAVEQDE